MTTPTSPSPDTRALEDVALREYTKARDERLERLCHDALREQWTPPFGYIREIANALLDCITQPPALTDRRTPGTVEVCAKCKAPNDPDDPEACWDYCCADPCPIRSHEKETK